MQSSFPTTLDEAVKICLLTMTPEEKELLRFTPEDRLVWFHLDWAVNLKNDFGMLEGNTALLESCGASNPDEASIVIVEAVRKEMQTRANNIDLE